MLSVSHQTADKMFILSRRPTKRTNGKLSLTILFLSKLFDYSQISYVKINFVTIFDLQKKLLLCNKHK